MVGIDCSVDGFHSFEFTSRRATDRTESGIWDLSDAGWVDLRDSGVVNIMIIVGGDSALIFILRTAFCSVAFILQVLSYELMLFHVHYLF